MAPRRGLQIFSLFGIGIAIVSVIVYLSVMLQRVLAGEPLDTLRTFWDRDILQFFLTGLVLFGLGLVGEYVGRIYQQVRQRPRYLIQAVLEKESTWEAKRSSSATGT